MSDRTQHSKIKGVAGRKAKASATLRALQVIDELVIGPVRVERRRVTAPYTVVQRGSKHTIEHVFRYGEDVFDPKDPADHNLACMVVAQVALNYGLFARRIVFRGSYDESDRRFLREMAENTAREIYVKKFLEPNPFITGAAARVPVVKRNSYLAAELVFETDSKNRVSWERGTTNPDRVAILSSGGKDSLLTFGLMGELGYEVHPIFGNESGRHWFTALNAYRHFSDNVPHAARVWMNSDRIFAWMLRRLPFVREDFADVRSDEYPIRLWTLAVFLFGVLPIVRKRGAGCVLIGDEYDTSARSDHQGITHYNGLYDQSRYFDNALSRYYGRKSWSLSQFSVLRPLSEMLIERVLVQRYPRLFEHQTSCHATHMEGDRVHPCGKCEKCRRIVGMVIAAGGDPALCGYTPAQIDESLAALVAEGVHQERSGAEHLTWMLKKQKKLPRSDKLKHSAKEHPEILKLRFDKERSPIDGIPSDLRMPLYSILLEHAAGSVRRRGRMWMDFDVLSDSDLKHPYQFEKRRGGALGMDNGRDKYILGEMTWPEAKTRFEEVDIALLPVGAIEQHGPHLPLDTDAFDAQYLATEVAKRCTSPRPIVLPMIPYGVSYHHDEFSGTISIGNNTLADMVYQIGMGAAKNGITKLVIINGHGGNAPSLSFAAQQINRDARIFVGVDTGETSDVDVYSMIDTPNDVHAGEIETSTSLATRPELVRMEHAEKLVPKFSSRYLNFTSKRAISWYAFTKRISQSGVMGDPTKASAEKGRKMWDVMIEHLVAFVEDLKQLSLDEIFQKRY